jgi:hypothetical protein
MLTSRHSPARPMRLSLLAAALITLSAHAAQGATSVVVKDGQGDTSGAQVCVLSDGAVVAAGRADAAGVWSVGVTLSDGMVVRAHKGARGGEVRVGATPAAPPVLRVNLSASSLRCPEQGGRRAEAAAIRAGAEVQRRRLERDPIGGAPAVLQRPERCFGALGNQCGQLELNQGVGLPTSALCVAGACSINAGSWEHDECCVANPRGLMCALNPVDHDGSCVDAWNKALLRLFEGFVWSRQVDFSRVNATGRVEFARYCAQEGALVHAGDPNRCCSRRFRAQPSVADVARIAAQVKPIAVPFARVCD